jgi:hypothetical protein
MFHKQLYKDDMQSEVTGQFYELSIKIARKSVLKRKWLQLQITNKLLGKIKFHWIQIFRLII